MKTMTIRNVPEDVARALKEEQRRRGTSLNETVICLIRQALGLGGEPPSNGLGALAGTWSCTDFEEFSEHVEAFGHVDEELWE